MNRQIANQIEGLNSNLQNGLKAFDLYSDDLLVFQNC